MDVVVLQVVNILLLFLSKFINVSRKVLVVLNNDHTLFENE